MSKSSNIAEEAIRKIRPQRTAHHQAQYVGAGISSYEFLELSMPQVREFAKQADKFLKATDPWGAWDSIWQSSKTYDLLLAATIWVSEQPRQAQWHHRQALLTWARKANNWALADSLCSIYAGLYESQPKAMAMVLDTWSRSKDPWLRRISIISLFYYSRSRERLPSFSFAKKMILRQLHDDHYYVQKAVGWALRESWNVYPQKTFELLVKHAKEIPSPGWTAATEKLSLKERRLLKKIRRKN